MDDSLEIKLNYTAEDFARTLPDIHEHVYKRRYWIYILPIGMFLGIIGLISSMSYKTDTPNYPAMIIFASIPALIMLAVVWILDRKSGWIRKVDKITPRVMDREVLKSIKKNPHLSEEITITVSDKGINFSSASISENLDWIILTKSVETKSDIFLFTLTNEVRFIPKRALASEAQKNLLDDLIKRNLGRANLS